MDGAIVFVIFLFAVIAIAGVVRAVMMIMNKGKFDTIINRLDKMERALDRQSRQSSTQSQKLTKEDESNQDEDKSSGHPSESSKPSDAIPAADKLVACLKKASETIKTPVEQPEIKPEPPHIPPTLPAPAVTKEMEIEPDVEVESKPIYYNKETATNDYSFAEFEPVEREKSEFEKKALDVLKNIWMWIIVGDDFRRKDVSREYALATTWLVRVAVIILLAGGAFFLKYSIDRNLMPPAVRVLISTVCALGMLGFGIKLIGKEKKYDLLGRGIGGGGLALLYFSVFAASSMYHLIEPIPGFALMVLITATAWIVSVRKNVMLMAIFGIVGGYMTPILLSTGEKNLYGLFAYMLLLGIGTLLISRHRDWKLLNWLSFFFTYSIFFAVLNKFYGTPTGSGMADYVPTMIFLSCYFVLFSCMALTFNIHNKKSATLLELYTILTNTVIFLATAWVYTIKHYDRAWVACYSLGAAAFFIAHIIWFLRKRFKDRNLILMLFGFSAFCIVLTFPLALSGVWITASWAAMAVLLLYLALRIGSKVLLVSAYVLYFVTAWRVFFFDYANKISWSGDYLNGLTDHLLSGGMLCVAFIAGYKLLQRYGDEMPHGVIPSSNDLPVTVSPQKSGYLFMWISVILGFIFLNVEVPNFSKAFYPLLREPLTALLWGGMLVFLIRMAKQETRNWLSVVTAAFAIILSLKLMFFDLHAWHFSPRLWAYGTEFNTAGVLLRTVGFGFVLFAVLFGFKSVPKSDTTKLKDFFGIIALIQLFIFLTLELSSALYQFTPGFRPGGVSILWAIFAFGLIYGGILKNIKGLRYAGLVLFAVDVIKIFLCDLDDLDQIYRIIAFITLGLVFLAGGFIYIKCREQFCLDTTEEINEQESGE
jgi:uncharacterized membrane protein